MQFSLLDRVIYWVISQFHFWVFARRPLGTPGVICSIWVASRVPLGRFLGALGLPCGALAPQLAPHGNPLWPLGCTFGAPVCQEWVLGAFFGIRGISFLSFGDRLEYFVVALGPGVLGPLSPQVAPPSPGPGPTWAQGSISYPRQGNLGLY